MSGFLMWSVVVIVILLLSFKIGPPYFEYMVLQKQLKEVANNPAVRSGTRKEMENDFMTRSMVSDIKSVSYKDIVITKEGDGVVLSAEYTVCVPIVSNVRACMDFSASSDK